jgi:hypothetical protein
MGSPSRINGETGPRIVRAVHMYVNGKMRPVETVPGMRKRGTKENDGGVDSTMIYCKNSCKRHNVSPAQQ